MYTIQLWTGYNYRFTFAVSQQRSCFLMGVGDIPEARSTVRLTVI